MRISDLSSDVCSSDLPAPALVGVDALDEFRHALQEQQRRADRQHGLQGVDRRQPGAEIAALALDPRVDGVFRADPKEDRRSEEHTSELQSLMRISYAVFCLKKKKTQ